MKTISEASSKKRNTKHQNHYNYTNNCNSNEIEIILCELEFAWRKSDIDIVIKMWKQDVGIVKISEEIKRNIDETFLLLLHLSRKGKIKKRDTYIYGGK